MKVDPEGITRLLEEAAQTAVMPYFQQLTDDQIGTKSGPNDLVTAADLACERFLAERLDDLHPGSVILGEEGTAEDPRRLDLLAGDEPVWIIDPVDGTYNFTHGDETFAILLALARHGEVLAGWIHFPTRGATLWAVRGEGAHRADGTALTVAPPDRIGRMTAVLYVGKRRAPALHDRVKAVRGDLGPLRFARCVAKEYEGLATGEIHYAIFTRQLPWDHAAGMLIHAEAGGAQAFADGQPYRLLERDVPLILAPDEPTWHALRDFFLPED